jgi:Mobilization protein NikA
LNANEQAVEVNKELRDRKRPLKVWVTATERTDIVTRAAGAGLSVSAYLRAAGMNHPLRSAYDLAAVEELAKVGADLGRLGGLLKLWLATKRGEGAPALDVDRLLKETRDLQAQMLKVMGRV